MSGPARPGQPPRETQFRKGQSGNPKGRPRKIKSQPSSSAFEIVLDRSLTVMQGGQPRELTLEEALQHKTYQDALGGNRAARREILKMIAKREKWLAERAPRKKAYPVEVRMESEDPENHIEAMLLLGIIEQDARWNDPHDQYKRHLLQPWAVQTALSRSGSKKITEREVADIKRCTRDVDTLRWPASFEE